MNEEPTTGVLAHSEPKPFACTRCSRSFDSPQALSLHTVRMHTGHYKSRKGIPRNTDGLTKREKKNRYNAGLRARNIAMGLTSAGKPRKVPYRPRNTNLPPSGSKEYKRMKYLERTAMFRAQGLTAQGRIPSKPLKGTMSGKALSNVQRAQAARRAREQQQNLLNGAAPTPELPADNLGETARAIILTAQVLRSVLLGLKL